MQKIPVAKMLQLFWGKVATLTDLECPQNSLMLVSREVLTSHKRAV